MSEGMKTTIAALYEYGQWANERLLEKCRGLDQAALTRRFSEGTQPILPTLLHLYGADLRWLARWRRLPPPEVKPADYPSVETIEAGWRPLWAERRAYLDGLDQPALDEQIPFTRPAGTLWIVAVAGHRPLRQPCDPAPERARHDAERSRSLAGRHGHVPLGDPGATTRFIADDGETVPQGSTSGAAGVLAASGPEAKPTHFRSLRPGE